MFVGHYAPSFALRRASEVPLSALFIASQLIDIIWATLVLTGIEKVRIVPGFTSSSPLALDYMPYSHSLTATLAWSLLAGLVGAWIWNARGGVAIGVCVIAHWLLDLPVHVPDLPLYGNAHKVGFGLWKHAVPAFALEAALLIGSVALYTRGSEKTTRVWIFALAMLGLQSSAFFAPLPEAPEQFAAMALVNYFGLAGVAGWLERSGSGVANRAL